MKSPERDFLGMLADYVPRADHDNQPCNRPAAQAEVLKYLILQWC